MVQDSIIANSSLTTVYIWALKDGNLPLFFFTLYCLSIEWWYNQPNEFPPKFLLKIPTGSWGDSPAAYVAERMSLLNKFKLVHFGKMMKIYKNLELVGISSWAFIFYSIHFCPIMTTQIYRGFPSVVFYSERWR